MSLEIVFGCMYSGKSTELCRRIKRLQTINKSYIIYNSNYDNRYGPNGIYTHDRMFIQCQCNDNLMNYINTDEYIAAPYIFIEESQFFDDLYNFVKISVEKHNKHVVVFGLDGDSNRENFGQIHMLIPIADDITKLKALCSICNDGTPGIFSKKIINSSTKIDIGSVDKYIAVCRPCYLK